MKQELENKLYSKYPLVYSTPVPWGLAVGDGWYQLLDTLSAYIESHLKHTGANDFKVNQVKEKFGGLRFYTNSPDPYINGLISMAEGISFHTCEICGKPGVCQGSGWIKTRCSSCD